MSTSIDEIDLITYKLKNLKLNDNINNSDNNNYESFNFTNLPILTQIFKYLNNSDLLKVSQISKFWYNKSISTKFKSIKPFYYTTNCNEFKRIIQTHTSNYNWDIHLLGNCFKIIGNQNKGFVNHILIDFSINIEVYKQLFNHFININYLEFSDHLVNLENLIVILSGLLINLKGIKFRGVGFQNVDYLKELENKPTLPLSLISLEFTKFSKLTEINPELINYFNSHQNLIKFELPIYKKLLLPLEQGYKSLLHLNIVSLKVINFDYLDLILLQNNQLKSLSLHSKQISKRILKTIAYNLNKLRNFEILGDPLQNVSGIEEIPILSNLTKFDLKVSTTHQNVLQLVKLFPNLLELTLYDHIFPTSLNDLISHLPLLKRLNLTKYRLEGVNFDKLLNFRMLFVIHCVELAPWDWGKSLEKIRSKFENNWKFKEFGNELIIYSKNRLN